jgi:hypothetical protein
LSAQGVISESLISFNLTWSNPGKGQQSNWDQTKQGIEIHETDVYPDLQYTSAYASPLYTKYTSGALLNDLISEINGIIDARIASESKKENEAKAALPAGPDAPKQLGTGEEEEEEEEEAQKALPAGPDAPKQLAGYSPVGDLVKVEEPGLPAIIDTNPEEVNLPEVKPDETTEVSDYAYTVVVRGDRLRFLEGQQERGAYSAGVKFLYQVSNNLSKVVSGETIDNKTKIWAEIKMAGLLGRTFRMEFPEFDEKEFKFGGNLLAQILPSVELSFTPDQNSVYSKEKPELDIADVIKATNITLGSKTTSEIKALQKQIQKEIEAREPSQSEGPSDKQVASDKNK